MERTVSTKCEAMGSTWRTSLVENKCERIHKDRRRHYVSFHDWNQSKCTNTSRARYRPCVEEYEIESPRLITWWSVISNRLGIQKLQGNWRPHNSWRRPILQEMFWRNRDSQILPNSHPKAISWQSSAQPAWRICEAPRSCQNNNCLHGKILFCKNGAIDQGMGHVTWAKHQRITNLP